MNSALFACDAEFIVHAHGADVFGADAQPPLLFLPCICWSRSP